jgi:hypothetical protein
MLSAVLLGQYWWGNVDIRSVELPLLVILLLLGVMYQLVHVACAVAAPEGSWITWVA